MNRFKTIIEFGFRVTEKIIQILRLFCIGQIEISTSFSPGIPRAFDVFAVPGRREFDYQSLPGDGEFEPYPRFHVESLLQVASYSGERGVRTFSWKRFCLCGQLVTRKGLKQAFCRIWNLKFKFKESSDSLFPGERRLISLQYSGMLSISLRFHCLSPDMYCTAFSHAKPPRNIHAARKVTLPRY